MTSTAPPVFCRILCAMSIIDPETQLVLGTAGQKILRLSPAILQASFEHARRIAASLGSQDAESSLAGYWSLDSRIQQWQRIADHIGIEQARCASFVEVGSGLGLFALTGSALGFHVVGVEASSDRYAESIAIARALFRENGRAPTIVQAYSEALPLPDASADVVASFQTLEHVSDLGRTLGEIRRILKPGGLFFAQAPNYTSFYEAHYGVLAPLAFGKAWMRRALRLYRRPTGFLDHLQWLDPKRLRVLLGEVGFTAVQVGPIAVSAPSAVPLPARAERLPFHFRRGARAQWLANRLALAHQLFTFSADHYSQIEVWAIA